MKENKLSFDTLLDSEATVRKIAVTAIRDMGKIIALITTLLAVTVTFTEVRFGAVFTEEFFSSLLLLLSASYIIYFSLEDAGERTGEESAEYLAARERYLKARESLDGECADGFREYLKSYCEREHAYRVRCALFSLGITESDLLAYQRGERQDKKLRRAARRVARIKPIMLSTSSLLSLGKLSRESELESPEHRKLRSLILRLIPSTVCMTVTVSVVLSTKDGLTAADIIDGILKLSALPLTGFKGYSAGYTYAKHRATAWLETKSRVIEEYLNS